MRYTEHHHNTPAQVRDYLAEALAIVSELDPDAELRVAVFTKAADLTAAKQVIGEAIMPGVPNLAVPRGL